MCRVDPDLRRCHGRREREVLRPRRDRIAVLAALDGPRVPVPRRDRKIDREAAPNKALVVARIDPALRDRLRLWIVDLAPLRVIDRGLDGARVSERLTDHRRARTG